jgi:hypothetical protein
MAEYLIDPKLFQRHLAGIEPLERGNYIMLVAINMVTDSALVKEPWVREKPPARKPRKKKVKAFNQGYTAEFERFWSLYPRKESKGTAFAIWQELDMDKDELAGLCAEALAWQSRSPGWKDSNGKYIPKGENYLAARSWEDEDPNAGQGRRMITSLDGEEIYL